MAITLLGNKKLHFFPILGIPSKNSKLMVAPYEPNEKVCVGEPFSLEQWLDRNSQRLNNGKLDLFQGEFKAEVIVYGTGEDEVVNEEGDTFIWAIVSLYNLFKENECI